MGFKVLSEFKKKPDTFKIPREDKIGLFKEEKNAKAELLDIENKHDRICREIHLQQFDCLNIWLYFPIEIQMMKFREKLENNKQIKEKYDNRHKGKPKKKLQPQFMMINNDGTIGKFLIYLRPRYY